MTDYPGSVWDGLSPSRPAGQYARPSPEDWEQMVAEIVATQTELDEVKTKPATITLTSAQILDCKDTPIEVIPAPGAGKAIIVEQVVAKLDFVSAAYSFTTVANLSYTNISGAIIHAFTVAFLEASADAFMAGASTLLTGSGASTNVTENAAVVFNAPDADPITGDSTITLAVRYRIVEL